MLALSTTVKRLATAVLGAALLSVGAPLMVAAPAQAATPSGQAQVSFVGGVEGQGDTYTNVSTRHNGYAENMRISVNATVPGPGYAAITRVKASMFDNNNGSTTQIADLSSAPYTFTAMFPSFTGSQSWQTVTAIGYDANGNEVHRTTSGPIFNHMEWTNVAITTPSSGDVITTDGNGSFFVQGRRSSMNGAPGWGAFKLSWQLRDNSDGSIGAQQGTVIVPASGSQNWTSSLSPSGCPNSAPSGCDVLVRATVMRPDLTDRIASVFVNQFRTRPANSTPSNVTIAPSSQSARTDVQATYNLSTVDQWGINVGNVSVNLNKSAPSGSPNTATVTPTSLTTDYYGNATFTVTDAYPEVTTVTTSGGTTNAGSATYTTIGVTGGSTRVTPSKALSATGNGVSEYNAGNPTVRACFSEASGTIDSSRSTYANKIYATVTRTTRSGGSSSTGSPVYASITQDQSANPGCYIVAHAAAGNEEQGSDTFTGYYEGNGTNGYQAGTADAQTSSVTVAWGQLRLAGSTGTAQTATYGTVTFTAKTPDGQNFVGRTFNVSASPGTSTMNPTQPSGGAYLNGSSATCLTDSNGVCSISVTDPGSATTTLTATDNVTDGGLNQSGTGTSATAQITFNAQPPTTGVFTKTPSTTLYATAFTGTQAGTGSTLPVGSDYTASTPVARLCFSYTGGSPIDSSNSITASKVFATVTRTTKVGTTSTSGATTAVSLAQDQSANPGCFTAPHPAAGTEDQGSDAYTGYYNVDGAAGYQAGGGDVLAAPATLAWGQLKLTGTGATGQKGTYVNAVFTAKTPDNQSFAGRTLSLTVTSPASSTFNPTQPSGTVYANAKTAICTTDSNGRCAVSVTDLNTASTVITASDNLTNSALAQIATGGWATASVTFNSVPGGLDSIGTSTAMTVLQPAVNTGPARQRPGDIGHYSYTLLDNNAIPMAAKTVALSLSQGYFTPDCLSYAACTFSPAPANGKTVGAASSLGQSMNATSDANGVFTFATSIARDVGLDANGQLAVGLTVIGANGSATAALTTFSTLGTAFANGSSLNLVPLTGNDALSGTVASNGTNSIPGQTGLLATPGSNFQLRVTDGFGNLATLSNCAVHLTLTPSGPQTTGGAAYLGSPGNTSANGCGSFTTTASLNGITPESFHLDSDNPSSTANAVLLTASWAVPWTRFAAVTGPPAAYTTTAGTAPLLTDNETLSLYALDQRTLSTAMSQAPNSTVQVNTPVTVTAKVTDSSGNPLAGASVTWQRSGPSDASGAPQTVGGTSTTSATGTATFGFTSPTTGTAVITAITRNASGTELTRGTASTTFITGPTPTTSPAPAPTGTASPTPGPTGTASPNPTATGTASPTPTGSATATPTGNPTATPTATPTPNETPSPVPTSPAGSVVTISGGDWQTPRYGTVFTITGTAPAGSVVTLRFHKSGTPVGSDDLTRTLTTPASGVWTRAVAASFDYRYYATLDISTGATGTARVSSGNVLFQPGPVVGGPLDVFTAKNLPFTITGKAAPYSLLFLHFHKQGTPAADYSIVRTVRTNSIGTWSRAILASSDYRYYASRNAGDTPAGWDNYRFVAR